MSNCKKGEGVAMLYDELIKVILYNISHIDKAELSPNSLIKTMMIQVFRYEMTS